VQQAEQEAITLEIDEYEKLIDSMETELQSVSRRTAKLEDLERKHQAATAIYVSAAAKSDLGQSDIYASYPMTQMLVTPILPQSPEKLKQVFALIGAIVGSLLIILSLVVAWKRSALLQKVQKKK